MGVIKQIDIKNRTYYFYNDIIDLKDFDARLLKIDKKSYKNIAICNIGYIKIKKIDDFESIYSVNPLSHPATRRRGDGVTTSLCTSQRRRKYVSNETPNNVSMERR